MALNNDELLRLSSVNSESIEISKPLQDKLMHLFDLNKEISEKVSDELYKTYELLEIAKKRRQELDDKANSLNVLKDYVEAASPHLFAQQPDLLMSDPCPGCTVCDRDPQLGDQLNLSELQYLSRSYLTRSSLSSGFLDGNSPSYTSIFNISAISTAESNEESRYETASDDSGIGL